MGDEINVSRPRRFCGEVTVPGDKSISHRSVLIGSLAKGKTEVTNFLRGEDCISTISCMRLLGVEIEDSGTVVSIEGKGLYFKEPSETLDAGNSGTTARLILGALAAQPFSTTLTGDDSLRNRPMLRVVNPLRHMGAEIKGKDGDDRLPLHIKGRELIPLEYELPVPSAQVKSAVLLAGLYARGKTVVKESRPSRDHTERMLELCGAELEWNNRIKALKGPAQLSGFRVRVPGDISSAAYMMVAAAVIPGAEVILRDVGLNPTRVGILDVLEEMGANLEVLNRREFGNEPVGDIRVMGKESLKAVTLEEDIIPRLIDEIPVIAVAALMAEGTTEIKGAGELRKKESDRIQLLTRELSRLGACIEEREDGLKIEGNKPLKGSECFSHGDHRLAMALTVAGLVAAGKTKVKGTSCAGISYPAFEQDLRRLTGNAVC